ncbi:hypothetical protein P154DRAFT_520788 [Amniculicola lignicola CBS 123094]|uniref:Uncharacterized protein n=1 Tax=Amniculicola lignicola CBS 123094 TaxID=1392246 RepID=A0A6A5WPI2_9PLEO|nr:hypothetical protein P154DRAFT_520788 [Amniculicola lignicola CBS 123094]
MLQSTLIFSFLSVVSAALTDSSLVKHVDSLTLSTSFNPIKESYWTGLPHHRRTPFAISPDGKSAYLAYLAASETDVHVQQVDPSTFAAVGTATTVTGAKEAGGLVAHNDGFALLTNEPMASGTQDAPADSTPVPVLYRYTSGKQSWKTYLGGPGVHTADGLSATPDINGDLAYSEATGMYGAYFVVTAYTGWAAGHFGDSIQYVNDNGTLETIAGASSSWGCSHNTGIAFEAADSVPFASICAEDQGAIWLNTETQTMDGVKISNENVTNGASNEPMGGMSGSYSGLARFIDSDSYIFTWVSRGAKDLTVNDWLGAPFTHSVNKTVNRNVAIATFSDKNTLDGAEASSTIGAADGDSQVNWITTGSADCQNAHVAAFDKTNALVTWEEIAQPQCNFLAMGCQGAYTGSYFQQVQGGEKVGTAVKATDVYVAGDMVTMADGRICWPYVSMAWKLDGPVNNPASVTKMSFACMSLGSAGTTSAASVAVVSSTPVPSSTSVPASTPTSVVQEVAVSSATPAEPATSAAPVIASSSQADSNSAALPSFSLVGSSGLVGVPSASAVPVPSVELSSALLASSVEPPSAPIVSRSSAAVASSTSCTAGAALPSTTDSLGVAFPTTAVQPILVPVTPIVPTNPSELPLPSSVALTLLNPSSLPTDLPTAIPITDVYSVIQPSEILSLPTAIPVTNIYSVIDPTAILPSGTAPPVLPSSISIAFPVFPSYTAPASGSGGMSYPTGKHNHAHHSGRPHGYGTGRPTGIPRPTGGFGFATARPSGGFPGASGKGASKAAVTRTRCTLETRVRPSATGA